MLIVPILIALDKVISWNFLVFYSLHLIIIIIIICCQPCCNGNRPGTVFCCKYQHVISAYVFPLSFVYQGNQPSHLAAWHDGLCRRACSPDQCQFSSVGSDVGTVDWQTPAAGNVYSSSFPVGGLVVRGHPRSSETSPFDRAHITFYSTLTETMRLSCTIFDLFVESARFLPTHLHLSPP